MIIESHPLFAGCFASFLATISYICFLAVPLETMYRDGISFGDVCNTAGYVCGIIAYTSWTCADYYYYKYSKLSQTQLVLPLRN